MSSYQNFAEFTTAPPTHGRDYTAYYDNGQGVPQLTENNMTIQDIFRTPFLFLNDHHNDYSKMADRSLHGIRSESELSKLFFSDTNFKRLQNKIKKEIFIRTRGKFKLDADQDPQDLFHSMRAIYIEYAKFLPNATVRQVKKLNQKVLDEIVPSMIGTMQQHYGYLEEINRPLRPIPRPQNVNQAGRRVLPSITTTFGI